jgi:beta-galactosidase GanA
VSAPRFVGRTIEIDGRPQVLYGGEFQYFRTRRDLWAKCLGHIREMGCNLISCYIPWIWHEPEPGRIDFTGATLPERDLHGFLQMVADAGMWLLVRPGPYVYAEYQGFGIPDWFRAEHPELLMVHESGPGTEFVVNHPDFLPHVERWFRAVWAEIAASPAAERLVAWQVDNETGLPQFGTAPCPGEFNPHTQARYRAWLQQRFDSLAAVNTTMGTRWPNWDALQPPRRATATLPEMWLWADFVEQDLIAYLDSLRQLLGDMGVTVPLVLNDPCSGQWPNQFQKKTQVATIGFDLYTKINDGPSTHDLPFSNSYVPTLFRAANPDGPLMGMEVGCGWFNPEVHVNPRATMQLSMQLMARGTNLLSYYVLQDALEPDGTHMIWEAVLDLNGNPTPRYEAVRKVGKFLTAYGEKLSTTQEVKSPIAIAHYMPGSWMAIKPGISLAALAGLDGSALLTHFNGPASLFGVLAETGYNAQVVVLPGATLEQLLNHRVIFLCATGYMDDATYGLLASYVAAGGILITAGHPVRHDLLGKRYEENPLFPARPQRSQNFNPIGNVGVAVQATVDLLEYRWRRRGWAHRRMIATLDQMHPVVDMLNHIGQPGTWLQTDRGHPFWASRFISTWQGHGVNPLLSSANGVVGYSVRHGLGKSVFLGTLPGIFYDSPLYYSKDPKKKESIRRFFATMLQEVGIKPLHDSMDGVELVIREGEGGRFLFVDNKGPARTVTLSLRGHGHGEWQPVFTGWESRLVSLTAAGPTVALGEDDAMVLYCP